MNFYKLKPLIWVHANAAKPISWLIHIKLEYSGNGQLFNFSNLIHLFLKKISQNGDIPLVIS